MAFDNEYRERAKKITKMILECVGHQVFNGAVCADLGSGHCALGSAFARLVGNGKLIAVDIRPANLKVIEKTYPHVRTIKANLDVEHPPTLRSLDIALDCDLICHLKCWETHIRNVCNSTRMLILETAVMDSAGDQDVSVCPENKNIDDLSFNGFASYPSAPNIERILRECGMDFKRYDSPKLNSGSRKYDWKATDDKSFGENKRRFWIATKRADAKPDKTIALVSNPQYITPDVVVPAPAPIIVAPPTPLPQVALPTYPTIPQIESGAPKIAVCISGNLRTFEKTMSSFKHYVLGAYQDQADYFIHTWDFIGSKAVGYDAPLDRLQTRIKLDTINQIFNPKKLVIESQYDPSVISTVRTREQSTRLRPSDYSMFRNNGLTAYYSMLYSLKRSKDLLEDYERENNTRYDIVIKHRADLLFKAPFDIVSARDTVYIPKTGNFYRGAINDMFAIGSHSAIMTYLSVFDSVVHYLNARACEFRPEWIIKHHLNKNGIPFVEADINFGVLRCNGNLQTFPRY